MFKNLEDRFNQTVASLYGKADRSGNKQPFVEFRPNDPDANATSVDSVESPNNSVIRDQMRMSAFLRSPGGIRFTNKQIALQRYNTFSETRLVRDSFVLDNTIPGANINRFKATQLDYPLFSAGASIASFNLGHVGRLQKETKDSATARAFKTVNLRGSLSSIFSASTIGKLLGQKTYLLGSSLGINERPELNVNGDQLFSVMMWRGIAAEDPLISDVKKIAKALRIPIPKIQDYLSNFKVPNYLSSRSIGRITSGANRLFDRAFGSLGQPFKSAVISTIKTAGINAIQRNGLGGILSHLAQNPFNQSGEFQQLYFITDRNEANNITYLNPRFKELKEQEPFSINIATTDGAIANQVTLDTNFRPDDAQLVSRSERTLKSRYSVANIKKIVDSLHQYSTVGKSSIGLLSKNEKKDILDRGIIGGLNPAFRDSLNFPTEDISSPNYSTAIHSLPQRQYYIDDDATRIGFYSDEMNMLPVGKDNKTVVDYIKFKIVDTENKKVISLRATIHDLTENIETSYDDSLRYIGRGEKHVSYSGAQRTLNFSFYVYAYSPREMAGVWDRINHITGLAFPASHANGYMIAPATLLTIGDVYVDLPGYFKSVVHSFDNNIPWEITEGWQKPHGVKVTVSYDIFEKNQMTMISNFYPKSDARPRAVATAAATTPELNNTVQKALTKTSNQLPQSVLNKIKGNR